MPEGLPPGEKERNIALQIHRNEGVTAYAIAQRMKLSPSVVMKWIKRDEMRDPDSSRWLTESHFRFIPASNAGDWRKILRDEMKSSGFEYTKIITAGVPVRLICGTMNVHKGADYL